jgi:hypothetical protein
MSPFDVMLRFRRSLVASSIGEEMIIDPSDRNLLENAP